MGPLRLVESFVDQVARSERRLVDTIASGMGSLADMSQCRIWASRATIPSASLRCLTRWQSLHSPPSSWAFTLLHFLRALIGWRTEAVALRRTEAL